MSKETREYAKQLVSQMTLEEKMSQMVYQSPAIERLGIPAYNWWNEALHGVARAGVATVFPQAIGLAATFDKELLQEIGDVVSTEGPSLTTRMSIRTTTATTLRGHRESGGVKGFLSGTSSDMQRGSYLARCFLESILRSASKACLFQSSGSPASTHAS